MTLPAEREAARPVTLDEERYLHGADLSPDAMADNIARRILAGETEDEVFGEIEESIQEGLEGLEDYLYEPIIIHDVNYAKSKFAKGEVRAFGIYLVSRAKPVGMTLAQAVKNNASTDWEVDGDPFVASCGAKNVIAQIDRAKEAGWLPKAVQIVLAENETAQGYRPYWARAIDLRHALTPKPKKLADMKRTPEGVEVPEGFPGD